MTLEDRECIRPTAEAFISEGIEPMRAVRAAITLRKLMVAVSEPIPDNVDAIRQLTLATHETGVELTPREMSEMVELINEVLT